MISDNRKLKNPNERIEQARLARNLSDHQVASMIGFSSPEYYDLETYESETYQVVSISDLLRVAAALERTVSWILGIAQEVAPVSLLELQSAADRTYRASGLSYDTFCSNVGWELKDFFADARELYEFSSDALIDVCNYTNCDWQGIIRYMDTYTNIADLKPHNKFPLKNPNAPE